MKNLSDLRKYSECRKCEKILAIYESLQNAENVKNLSDLRKYSECRKLYINSSPSALSESSVRDMVFNATFNNISVISWRSVLFMEEIGENHRPVASH